jgi:ankyrin repeat protein
MDNSGLFALKYALIRRDDKGIEILLEKGANINQIDNKGRNLLHHAINMSSATADATFETEQFLIDRGVEVNLRDHKNRTPLHYAFVKIQDWRNNSQIDPIETVTSMCGIKGLEIDVPDKWLKTPLHYASQRGASICAIYMMGRGADLQRKDIYGNTPLAVGLLNGHYNYGIILIQKGATVFDRVFTEHPEKIAKKWKEEEELNKRLQDKKDGLVPNGD